MFKASVDVVHNTCGFTRFCPIPLSVLSNMFHVFTLGRPTVQLLATRHELAGES